MRLAREGMKVVINGRTSEAVEATATELRELGAQVLAVPADVGRTEGVNKLFDETLHAFDTVDVLVNNFDVAGCELYHGAGHLCGWRTHGSAPSTGPADLIKKKPP
jgi:NAD(P)-dependent dehydrogenase (short-subunit alcohol dehydrogenase family)